MGYELLLQVYNNNLNVEFNFIKKKAYFCRKYWQYTCYNASKRYTF